MGKRVRYFQDGGRKPTFFVTEEYLFEFRASRRNEVKNYRK